MWHRMEDLYCYTVTVKLSADEKVMNEVEAKKLKLWERRCEMIKVIASDMDGTLLNNNHVFSEKTIQSKKKLVKKDSVLWWSPGEILSVPCSR